MRLIDNVVVLGLALLLVSFCEGCKQQTTESVNGGGGPQQETKAETPKNIEELPVEGEVVLGEKTAEPTEPENLPPLTIVDDKPLHLGRLQDHAERISVVKVKNSGTADLKVERVMSNCTCTTIKRSPEKGEVWKPGEERELELLTRAVELVPGKFDRYVQIEVEGFDPFKIHLTGEVMSTIIPLNGLTIDLGVFEGVDVDFERRFKFEIKNIAPGESFGMYSPYENEIFHTRTEKISDTMFEIAVKPKLPFEKGIFVERLVVPLYGSEPAYTPLWLFVSGVVTGRRYLLSQKVFELTSSSEPVSFQTRLIQGPALDSINRMAKTKYKTIDPIVRQRVAVEEQNESPKRAYEAIDKYMTLDSPEGVTYEKKITGNGIVFDIKLAPQAMTNKSTLKIPVLADGGLFDTITVNFKKPAQ